MLDRANKPGNGRALVIVTAVMAILVGTGIMLYPQITDWRYALAQSNLAETTAGRGDEASAGPGSEGGIAFPDEAVALLRIPAIDLKAYVVEGTNRSALSKGPGHYPDTPLPGETGNSAIAGHRTMYGHPFHDLDLLRPGDEIFTYTADCAAVYHVVEVLVVHPTEIGVVAQTGVDRLTLTTCHPEGSSSRRLVVVAELTE